MAERYNDNVFLVCPFDVEYKPLFDAIVFSIQDAGFIPRCALEVDDAAQNRFAKIVNIIRECRYGIHDISRTETTTEGLPRFNMPLELGLFLGSQAFGGESQRRKSSLILDREPYRYQRFISDIAGQDIKAHNGHPRIAVRKVRDWPRTESRRTTIPGGQAIWNRFIRFQADLPQLCQELRVEREEITFADYTHMVSQWLQTNAP